MPPIDIEAEFAWTEELHRRQEAHIIEVWKLLESFNARLRDELLNREMFYTLKEAQVIVEQWRCHYNTKRPHSALGYRPPAPQAVMPLDFLAQEPRITSVNSEPIGGSTNGG